MTVCVCNSIHDYTTCTCTLFFIVVVLLFSSFFLFFCFISKYLHCKHTFSRHKVINDIRLALNLRCNCRFKMNSFGREHYIGISAINGGKVISEELEKKHTNTLVQNVITYAHLHILNQYEYGYEYELRGMVQPCTRDCDRIIYWLV